MGRAQPLKCIVLKKLAIILIIFIISSINIYIKGYSKNGNQQSIEQSESTVNVDEAGEAIGQNDDNQGIISNNQQSNKHGKQLTFNQIQSRSLLSKKENDNSQDSLSSSLSSSSSSSSRSVAVKDETKEKEADKIDKSETIESNRTQKASGKSKKKPEKEPRLEDSPTNGTTSDSKDSKSKKRKNLKNSTKKIISEDKNQLERSNETEATTLSSIPVTIRTHPDPPKTILPLIKNVQIKECTPPAYKEFPSDIFGHRIRAKGAVIIHIAVACYMFYCLAIVCDHYFLTSLEECSARLNLSNDVAGATLMAAGSSAPELFTAILGVFVAKGDVGTGTIVGSAVFNILFVIGLCGVFTASTVLTWWPVARDSTYYSFTVLLLILVSYDGEVTTFESSVMLIFYVVYILIMHFNLPIRDLVTAKLTPYLGELGNDRNIVKPENPVIYYQSMQDNHGNNYVAPSWLPPSQDQSKTSLYEAANFVIIRHKRLFPAISRFRAAGNLIVIRNRKRHSVTSQKQRQQQFNYKGRDGDSFCGKSKVAHERISQTPNVEEWSNVPNPVVEGWFPVIKWCMVAPLHATLFYTIPSCKVRTNLFLVTFLMSVFWIAIFSYIMVWMVTLVGYTFGIPDSIMGITFLAAGTSIPDAYASIHVARMGQGDMAVSNSIGSNVFDILVGLALPWFVETAMWQPGTTASINSRGLFYAIILLFLSLMVTIYLFHRNQWTLNPKLGYALLATYAVFLVFCGALELNLLGYVNPVMCDE